MDEEHLFLLNFKEMQLCVVAHKDRRDMPMATLFRIPGYRVGLACSLTLLFLAHSHASALGGCSLTPVAAMPTSLFERVTTLCHLAPDPNTLFPLRFLACQYDTCSVHRPRPVVAPSGEEPVCLPSSYLRFLSLCVCVEGQVRPQSSLTLCHFVSSIHVSAPFLE
jgi:hypothetical protein